MKPLQAQSGSRAQVVLCVKKHLAVTLQGTRAREILAFLSIITRLQTKYVVGMPNDSIIIVLRAEPLHLAAYSSADGTCPVGRNTFC